MSGLGPGMAILTQVLLLGYPGVGGVATVALQHTTIGLSGCAVLDPPHQAIGPSQTLQDDVMKHKLTGLEGYREKRVCL